jgi:hypothetical protein
MTSLAEIYVIHSLDDSLLGLIKDDPVRPEIALEHRVTDYSEIFILDEENPSAVICVAYRNSVPASVEELLVPPATTPSVAVFYTIWSYRTGAGRDMIMAARKWIELNRPNITQFITLSPPTEMARRFHLKNGATVYRVNEDTVNYCYS